MHCLISLIILTDVRWYGNEKARLQKQRVSNDHTERQQTVGDLIIDCGLTATTTTTIDLVSPVLMLAVNSCWAYSKLIIE